TGDVLHQGQHFLGLVAAIHIGDDLDGVNHLFQISLELGLDCVIQHGTLPSILSGTLNRRRVAPASSELPPKHPRPKPRVGITSKKRDGKRRERWQVGYARSAGTGMYFSVHEDAEHRTEARCRAQQLYARF